MSLYPSGGRHVAADERVFRTPNQPAGRIPTQQPDAIEIFPPKEECLFAKARHRLLPNHTAINSSSHGHIELCPSPKARPPYHIMEEFQEAEILWPSSADDHHDDHNDGIDTSTTAVPSVRSKSRASPELSAPVEISRRKRRCRPWAAPEHAVMFDQETDGSGGEDDDDAKQSSEKGLTVVVPPHILLARRRLLGSRKAAHSMCAGKGRTLKGRDLRDIRNLVLKMTGFIEK
ncbi:hypothetical protein HU200_026659 [Digitaria exilis]|uniref:Uncharacterized protein n=1 Tax=Digitaria exilis TaxID=1010633 RepID=A0A835BYK0_9POAL|nr:hypothetical protein HU200_026659 [Digitaria exilis]